MAMYYQSNTDIQGGDGLQTLYLMNPNYLPYSDTQSQPQLNNMLFFNPHAPPLSHNPSRPLPVHQQDISVAGAARHHYGMWGTVDQNQQTPPRGLSLSLSARHQESSISGDRDFPASESNVQRAIMGSKYLKIAQELLDEVVNVGNDRPEKAKAIKDSTAAVNREAQAADKGAAAPAFAADDLTTAQKQEIQMKKVKLNTMLDEVEQRCREYDHQMQIIIASFEQAAGTGSAKSYTQLALKTILKQFRCLKSTISAQIKGLNKSLGEEEDQNEGSRLKFVDQQLRQQRALQQLGMMQTNAWRPQRGLPERAVSVLRAWLFQHFLHPYPKDSDKQMLAKQTGLTRSQVSNWFINARVRLWKPMVEEMYVEETKKQQQNNVDGPSIKPESTSEMSPPAPAAAVSPVPPSLPTRTNFAQLISSLNMDNLPEKSPKKPRNADHEQFSAENYLTVAAAANINGYRIDQQLAAAGNNFSLSLGLPPAQSFLSHRSFGMAEEVVMGGGGRISEGGPTNIGYEILDFQNRKSSFPPQLLPDFVT